VGKGSSRPIRLFLPGLIKDVRLIEIEGGPHNIGWTHPDEVNKSFLDFLAE